MTFSQFAQIMYTGANECTDRAEFVIHLTNQIMDGRPGRSHVVGEKKVYQNPIANKEKRRLYEFFDGDRSISKNDASTLYSSISLKKFSNYVIWRYSRDAQIALLDELEKNEDLGKEEFKGKLVSDVCAILFKNILYDLAKAKPD